MYGLAALALLMLSGATNAIPQGAPGTVICDQTPITPKKFTTSNKQDVSGKTGDDGWTNYDGDLAYSYSQPGQRQSGSEVSIEVGVEFGAGGEFDLAEALTAGLDFGLTVAVTKSTSKATVEPCPIMNDGDKGPCVCGLQVKKWMAEASGTWASTNECGNKITGKFDVTAPVQAQGSPKIGWRLCRSAESQCTNLKDLEACAGGL